MKRPKKRFTRQPVEADLIVGANVRQLRIDRDVTLAGLAASMGMSHQQLQKYETGSNRISAGVLYNLARYFSVPVETLFEVEGEGSLPDSTEDLRMQRRCHAIIDRTDSLETLESMAQVLRAITDNKK